MSGGDTVVVRWRHCHCQADLSVAGDQGNKTRKNNYRAALRNMIDFVITFWDWTETQPGCAVKTDKESLQTRNYFRDAVNISRAQTIFVLTLLRGMLKTSRKVFALLHQLRAA